MAFGDSSRGAALP